MQGALSRSIPWDVLSKEFMSQDFQNAIRKIPECDWVDQAYELDRKNGETSVFGPAKQVGGLNEISFFSLAIQGNVCKIYSVYVYTDGRVYQPREVPETHRSYSCQECNC